MSCHACACDIGEYEEVIEVAATYVYCKACCLVTTPEIIRVMEAAACEAP